MSHALRSRRRQLCRSQPQASRHKTYNRFKASILHNAWLGYEGDWLSLSRGNAPESIAASWKVLEAANNLASNQVINAAGLVLRQQIEDETDVATALTWELLGYEKSVSFAEQFDPPCEKLLK